MASVFKVDGAYRVEFTFRGKRRTVRTGRYADAADNMRRRLAALVELADAGGQPAGELRVWLDTLTPRLRTKLALWGLLDSLKVASAAPLAGHVADYLAHCRHVAQAAINIDKKRRYLAELEVLGDKAKRLGDLSVELVGGMLRKLKEDGAAAATVNDRRQVFNAFLNWAVREGRTPLNPLIGLPRLDEAQDRRWVRRALTDEELGRLLAVAGEKGRGRRAWYTAAALAGLRRGDLMGIRWGDVDLEAGTLTIRATVGKSRREDIIPLHSQLVEELRLIRPTHALPDVLPTLPVFPQEVQPLTVRKDFLRAGLARRVYLNAAGEPIAEADARKQIKEARKAGTKPAIRIKIDSEDKEGRIIDLHSMRTTLGTRLARAGVAPQLAQRIMRHSDYKTTLRHYTVLGLVDTRNALEGLPGIASAAQAGEAAATGTDNATAKAQ